jgi:uncharacterized delta-60 repeat protein
MLIMKQLSLFFGVVFVMFSMSLQAQPGTLDSTFGVYGKFKTSIANVYDNGKAIKIQPDGKIVVAGAANNGSDADFLVVRYLEDGSLDTDFGGDGSVITTVGNKNEEASAVTLQPDGKILAAGYFVNTLNKDFAVLRYLPNGVIDSTFSGDGKQTTTFNAADEEAFAVAVQPDGKILVAGTAQNIGTTSDFALARFNPNGALDLSFSADGKVLTDIALRADDAQVILIQPDSNILLVGNTFNSQNSDLAFVRYKYNGTPDPSFGVNGKTTFSLPNSNDFATSAYLLPDGKFLVGGYANFGGSAFEYMVARFNSNGSLDSTFNNGAGVAHAALGTFNDEAYSMAIQSNGKIVLAGETYNTNVNSYDFGLVRFKENGQLDLGFGNGGKVKTTFTAGEDKIQAIAVQSDDKIVATGLSFYQAKGSIAMARYLNSPEVGVLDLSGSVNQMMVYPNPVTDHVNLSFTLAKNETITTSLIDMQGKTLQIFEDGEVLSAGKYVRVYELLTDLAPGAYAIRIAGAHGHATIQILK